MSPTQYFDGPELPTSWRTQAYQNFESRSDYHIVQFSRIILQIILGAIAVFRGDY
jgi:hypothetical protein